MVKNNMPETLEGALSELRETVDRVYALAETVRRMTEDAAVGDSIHPHVLIIQRTVAHQFSIPVTALRTRIRTEECVMPRYMAMYLCRKLTRLGVQHIGRSFLRDHGVVLHAMQQVQARMETDSLYRRKVEALTTICTHLIGEHDAELEAKFQKL